MNKEERQKQLKEMKMADLKELAERYELKVSSKKKADFVDAILESELEADIDYEDEAAQEDFDYYESLANQEAQEEIAQNPVWYNLVCEMNMKDGQPFVYEHVADRPLLQQIMLNVCRDLYLDSKRAVKVANGDKTVKGYGPVFVSKKHNGLRMKDAMAKGAVKAAAEKVLSKDLQKKYLVINQETKHIEFKQAVQVLDKLNGAGLIHGENTDKDYAKFYTANPDEILAFLQAVGCLK